MDKGEKTNEKIKRISTWDKLVLVTNSRLLHSKCYYKYYLIRKEKRIMYAVVLLKDYPKKKKVVTMSDSLYEATKRLLWWSQKEPVTLIQI